jgi:hypothetical protein
MSIPVQKVMPNAMKSLFHYTSINTLALILKTKSIQFGRLDLVNDPTEGLVSDFHSQAPYIFISCWTENEEENFALWSMYTQDMRGVRIELRLPLFESYKVCDNKNFLTSEEEILNEEIGYFIVGGLNEPQKIQYTDDKNLLKPSIRDEVGLNIASVAKHKRSIWAFEQEYRYRLEILPIDKSKRSDHFPDRYQHLIETQTPPPIKKYLVKINDSAFLTMKITYGPKVQHGDIEIIESLVAFYNPTAKILSSKLTGLVR